MSWFSMYFDAFLASPLATIVASLFALFVLVHTLVPAVCQLFVWTYNYWDRGENPVCNWYIKATSSDPDQIRLKYADGVFELTEVDGLWVFKHTKLTRYAKDTRHDTSDLDSCPYSRGARSFVTREGALAWSLERFNHSEYGTWWIIGCGFGLCSFFTAWMLDWLLFSYTTQTIFALFFACFVMAVLKGGRYAFDLNKKVDKINKAMEKSDD